MRKVKTYRPLAGAIILGLSAIALPGCSYDLSSLYKGEQKSVANTQSSAGGTASVHTGAITPANTGGHVTVMHGDTLYAISRRMVSSGRIWRL